MTWKQKVSSENQPNFFVSEAIPSRFGGHQECCCPISEKKFQIFFRLTKNKNIFSPQDIPFSKPNNLYVRNDQSGIIFCHGIFYNVIISISFVSCLHLCHVLVLSGSALLSNDQKSCLMQAITFNRGLG